MRHHNRNKKFGRKRNQRTALMRSLARSLFVHGQIRTTEAKAKALRPFAERLITLARRSFAEQKSGGHARKGTTTSRRLVISRLGGTFGVHRLYKEVAPKYASRTGGYTRIIKTGQRLSDGARMAIIELVTDNK